ncbi:hypothetical protein EVA_21920, partial [gut metagenome]
CLQIDRGAIQMRAFTYVAGQYL